MSPQPQALCTSASLTAITRGGADRLAMGYAGQNTVAQSFLMLTTVQPLVAARSMAFSAPDW